MKRTVIIAEAGVNHNGQIELARKLIDVASEAGVDYVKFQTFKASNLASKNAEKATYQKENTSNKSESQLSMLKKLELTKSMHHQLIEHCKVKGIKFLSTGFDTDSIDFLHNLGMEFFKIPSGEITNLPYLRKIGSLGRPIVLSTGMADMEEISNAIKILTNSGANISDITVLHCNTEYPTPLDDVNLKAMNTIGEEFGVSVGYSDHTLGIQVPIAAVALGAKMIEKHFTLDRTMEGPDHKASLEPEELKAMVQAIRDIELALGSDEKKPSPSESRNKTIARKSIVASKEIKKGEVFTEENLAVKRPGNGISPMKWDEIIGTKATRDYDEDDLI